MEFKNSTSILFSNMGYVLKIFVWLLIAVLLTAAIGAAIIIPVYDFVASRTELDSSVALITNSVNGLISADISIKTMITQIADGLSGIYTAFSEFPGILVALGFAAVFLYFLFNFLFGLSYYPTADIINNIMSSNLRFGFASNMALNFKNACRFSAAKMLISFPVDVVFFVLMTGLAVGLYAMVKLFALPLLLMCGIVLSTLRCMLFSGWLPRVLYHPEEKVFTAWSKTFPFVKTNFKGFFKSFLIITIIAYMLATGFALPTFGLILFIVPAIYFFLIRAVELVGYYKLKGLCFYTDASTVINTVEFGYRSDNQDDGSDTLQ